jgi:hypothetical protein
MFELSALREGSPGTNNLLCIAPTSHPLYALVLYDGVLALNLFPILQECRQPLVRQRVIEHHVQDLPRDRCHV